MVVILGVALIVALIVAVIEAVGVAVHVTVDVAVDAVVWLQKKKQERSTRRLSFGRSCAINLRRALVCRRLHALPYSLNP